MLDLVGLRVDRLGHFVVAMADTDREDAAEEIQIFFAVGIEHRMILGVVDDQRLVVVGRDAGE